MEVPIEDDICILSTNLCRRQDLLANARPDLRSSYHRHNLHSFDTVWVKYSSACLWRCKCGNTYHRSIIDVISNNDDCRSCSPIGRGYSREAISWLKTIAQNEGIDIQYAGNGGEKRINLEDGHFIKCDGFCAETNTVYEYHGGFWHGNSTSEYNPVSKKSTQTLMERTLAREEAIRSLGYTLVVMWDHEWRQICRQR